MEVNTKTMKKYKQNNRFELKTVSFMPTHAQHERSESKKHERMEESAERRFGNTSFVDNVGKKMVNGKSPGTFTREQFEEKGKELDKTNKVTGLWYPHRSK